MNMIRRTFMKKENIFIFNPPEILRQYDHCFKERVYLRNSSLPFYEKMKKNIYCSNYEHDSTHIHNLKDREYIQSF